MKCMSVVCLHCGDISSRPSDVHYSCLLSRLVICVHLHQYHGVLNAAAHLIGGNSTAAHPQYVMSYIGCRFNNMSNVNCAHWCSTVCTASRPSTCQPCANNEFSRISAVAVNIWLRVDVWLFLPQRQGCTLQSLQFCCGWTISMELFDTDILLSTTEDFCLRQSVLFVSMLVTVILLLERANITTSYIQSYICCHSRLVCFVLIEESYV